MNCGLIIAGGSGSRMEQGYCNHLYTGRISTPSNEKRP